jgi:hypothetical protein
MNRRLRENLGQFKKSPEDEVSGGTITSGFTQLTVRTVATADNSGC